jgi:hypothetical protein
MHYCEEHQERETKLTNDIVSLHQWAIREVLAIGPADKIFVEFDKKAYGAKGDVDIVVWRNPELEGESVIAVEVKVMFLNRDGNFKSKKAFRHNKQIEALEKEGWDYVYFFDFIVVEPSESWFHEQAFEGFEKYDKTVKSNICGHIVFQVNSVKHKPESLAGSISHKVIKCARPNPGNKGRSKIISALRGNNA